MQLEIEKNPPASAVGVLYCRPDLFNNGWSATRKQFEPNLVKAHEASELLDQVHRRRGVGNVERQDDFVFCWRGRGHRVQCLSL